MATSSDESNDLISSDRHWLVHQIGDGTLLLGLRDSAVNCCTMWRHFDGLNNSFLYPLNNRRNFLNDHLFLHSWIFNVTLSFAFALALSFGLTFAL